MATRVGLRVLPFDTLQRLVAGPARARVMDDRAALETARAVRRVGRRLPGTTCLADAMATWWLLQRQGVEADLHVGLAHDDERRIVGHAWVVHNDRVIIGETDRDYTSVPIPMDERA